MSTNDNPSSTSTGETNESSVVANIAVIGAGWWSQGWHLPVLYRNPKVNLIAIVDTVNQPTSKLNPNLEPLTVLEQKYKPVRIYQTVDDLLTDPKVGPILDGVLVATPHATHYAIARQFMDEIDKRHKEAEARTTDDADDDNNTNINTNSCRPLHILMEKPMTTDLDDAINLYKLVVHTTGRESQFWINHSANYRVQTGLARTTIASGRLGKIRHVTAYFSSPLKWIFNDSNNPGWNTPTGNMVGNGFAWGQSSHLLAFLFHILPTLIPLRVYCKMTISATTGADVSHSATIECVDEDHRHGNGNDDLIVMSVSGTGLLPGHQYANPPIGKLVQIEIYGDEGSLHYSGNDLKPTSGQLEYRHSDGTIEVLHNRFEFESYENEQYGPESIQEFVGLCCRGSDGGSSPTTTTVIGANVLDGLRSVQVIDAMYKSHVNNRVETIASID